jgi:hypothetical protein
MLALASGCSTEAAEGDTASEDEGGASTDDIVNGDTDEAQSKVKRQSIGNCWLYATAGWAESLARTAGTELDLSESYWTYWHWFSLIERGSAKVAVTTTGDWNTAFLLIRQRGYMREGMDLVLDEAFGALALHRVEANIQPANHASVALARSAGFRLEGFSPRYLLIGGQWRDHERYAITVDEHAAARAGSEAAA